jgi:hypothetical protein
MDQPTLYHDGRIDKERIYHTQSVYESRILAHVKSEVFVIISTQKKQMLVPIDFLTGLHQDEGNSRFIDPIDPSPDYLFDQLRFSSTSSD